MESKLLCGGKNIVDHTNEQQRALDQRRHEIADQKVNDLISFNMSNNQWGTFPPQEVLGTWPCDVKLHDVPMQCSFHSRDCDIALQIKGPSKVRHLKAFRKFPIRIKIQLIYCSVGSKAVDHLCPILSRVWNHFTLEMSGTYRKKRETYNRRLKLKRKAPLI